MCAMNHYEELVRYSVLKRSRPDHLRSGTPGGPAQVRGGLRCEDSPIVSPPKAAKVILKHWDRHYHRTADLVVIEGPKAGGHLGCSPEEIQAYEDTGYDEKIREILT